MLSNLYMPYEVDNNLVGSFQYGERFELIGDGTKPTNSHNRIDQSLIEMSSKKDYNPVSKYLDELIYISALGAQNDSKRVIPIKKPNDFDY